MLLHAVALYATAILLGAMLFFSFVVTPVAFRALEAEQISKYLQALFPLYYLVIIICGAVGALMLALDQQPVPASLLALVAGFALLMRQFMLPRLEALRAGRAAGEPAATRQFRRLHAISMVVNLTQIIVLLAVLFTFVR